MKLLDKIKSKFERNSSYIGIFVSPRSYIEVIEYDIKNNSIIKHGRIELIYDAITRQISDISDFEINIIKLFDELDIPINSPAVLSLQTTFLGHITLPNELEDSEIKAVLTEQLESNFIFRNQPPEISYETVTEIPETRSIHFVYTAIQKQQIIDIQDALKKIGMNIIAIDTSYASLLRGLSVAGICTEDVMQGTTWQVLLINNNSVITMSIMGNRLVDFSDVPVAIKSFQPNEVCSVIASYTNDIINSLNPDHLIIISKTDEVSARELSECFNFSCKITCIDENKYITEPLFITDDPEQLVDIETVGAVFWNKSDIPLSFNFLKEDGKSAGINGPFELTARLFHNILLGCIAFTFLFAAAVDGICYTINSGLEQQYASLSSQAAQLENDLGATDQGVQVSSAEVVNKVFEKNSKVLQLYNALGSVIPEKLWLDSLELRDDLSTSIRGKAYSVDDIVAYYQNLIRAAQFQNLKISSIKVVDGNSSQTDNSGVSIVATNNKTLGPGTLPVIPNLPDISTQKYYEFTFGATPTAAPVTAPGNSPTPAASSAPMTPSAPEMPGGPVPGPTAG